MKKSWCWKSHPVHESEIWNCFYLFKILTSHCTHLPMASGKIFQLLGISAEIWNCSKIDSAFANFLWVCVCSTCERTMKKTDTPQDSEKASFLRKVCTQRSWILFLIQEWNTSGSVVSSRAEGNLDTFGVKVEFPQKHSFEIFLFCFVQLLPSKSKCFSLCLAAIILNPDKMHYVTILLIFIKYSTTLKFLLLSQIKPCSDLLRISEREKYKLVNHYIIIIFWIFHTMVPSAGCNSDLVAGDY